MLLQSARPESGQPTLTHYVPQQVVVSPMGRWLNIRASENGRGDSLYGKGLCNFFYGHSQFSKSALLTARYACRGCAGLSGYRYSSRPAATRDFKYLFWMYVTRRFNNRAICCAESIRHWQNATMAASTVSVAARLPTESTTAMRCPGTFSDSRNCALSEGFHSPCVRLIREGCALHLPLIWGVQRFRFYAHKRLGRSDR